MKKIEGWVSSAAFTDPCNSGCSFCQHMRPLLADQKATLVIGDERMFTESEVRELVDSLCVLPRFIPLKSLADTLEQTMREVAARHIDPQ